MWCFQAVFSSPDCFSCYFIWFYSNFMTVFSFCEQCLWNLDRDCTESIESSGWYRHFNNINSSDSCITVIFPFICVSFNFFHRVLYFSLYRSFTSLVNLFLGILLFSMLLTRLSCFFLPNISKCQNTLLLLDF